MKEMKYPAWIMLLWLMVLSAWAIAADQAEYRSKYIGEEKRAIKTLSAADIEQLRQGKGWGLAKAAELNGVPGPLHVLEMKAEIGLSAQQEKAVQRLYASMHAAAIPLGEQLVELERDLNLAFKTRRIDQQSLQQQLEAIAAVTAKLRYVHLQAHLATAQVLSRQQVTTYNRLRGYATLGDACGDVPPGHDPKMWRMHHGCD